MAGRDYGSTALVDVALMLAGSATRLHGSIIGMLAVGDSGGGRQ